MIRSIRNATPKFGHPGVPFRGQTELTAPEARLHRFGTLAITNTTNGPGGVTRTVTSLPDRSIDFDDLAARSAGGARSGDTFPCSGRAAAD